MALTDNLVAYYKLDGDSTDATGNGHGGTDTSITYGAANGIINNGADFNGTSSKITLASPSALTIGVPFSISAWAYPTAFSSGPYGIFADRGAVGHSFQGYSLVFSDGSTQKFTLILKNTSNVQTSFAFNTTSSINAWHHVVATVDGSGNVILYVDGVSFSAGTFSGTLPTTTDGVFIGSGQSGTFFYKGHLDEIGFWSRALTSTEVSQLYNSGAGLAYPLSTSTTWTKTLTETTTITPSLLKHATRTLTQSVTTTASLIRKAARSLSQSVTTVATLIKKPVKVLKEVSTSGNSGPNSPTAVVNDSTIGTSDWLNPTNIEADDAAYAAQGMIGSPSTGTLHYLKATGFGFSIPSDATIVGVVAEIKRKASLATTADNVVDSSVKLVKGGTIGGTSKADTVTKWPTTEAYATYGTSSDLWGNSLTATDINASNFGIAFTGVLTYDATGVTAYVNHVRVTVYYTTRSGITLSDTITSSIISGHIFTETLTLADSLLRKAVRTLSETITTSASLIRRTARTLVQGVTTSDAITALNGHAATLAEAVTLTASTIRAFVRSFSETATASDTFIGLKAIPVYLSDTATLADSLIRATTKKLTETVTTTASIIRSLAHSFSETATLTDTVTATSALSRVLFETITTSATLVRATTRPLAETLATTASIIRSTARTFTETVTSSDALTRSVAHAFAESVTLADTVAITASRTLSEALTAADSLIRTTARAFSEAITLSDTLTKGHKYGRVLTEAISAADSLIRGIVHVLTENVALKDLLRKLRNGLSAAWKTATRAVSAFTNKTRSSTSWTDQTRGSQTWDNKNRDV